MKVKNSDLPAMPTNEDNSPHPTEGLTKVEMIAMHLYSGMISATDSTGEWTGINGANEAVSQAYQLLEALDKAK